MKAFYIENPLEISCRDDLPLPETAAEDVLVKVRKVGFCGSDLNTFRGNNPNVDYPRIPGHEIAGEIVKKGSAVPENIVIGDRVCVLPYTTCGECRACRIGRVNACKNNQTLGVQRDGGMTEFIAVPYSKLITGLNELTFESIALVEPLAVGFHAAERAEVQPGDYMIVFGCGMVGLGAIARAKQQGARIIAVDIDDEKLALAMSMGAEFAVNSAVKDLRSEVSMITEGYGADVVLEAIGLAETFIEAVELAAFGGRVVYVGYAKKPVEYETKNFILKELQIRGSRNAVRNDFENVLEAIKNGYIPVSSLITSDVPLEKAGEMLGYWEQNPGKVSKILVTIA